MATTRRKTTAPAPARIEADVAIVGAGPVGLVLANTLGALGVRTLVVERLDAIIDYPRAIGIDDEALRTIQATGLADEVRTHITPDHWMRFVTASGRCFASIEPRTDEFGWSRRNAFIQPEIDRILYRGLARFPHVAVRLGHALEGFSKSLALEGAAHGILSVTVTPGMYMHTPMSETTYSAELRAKWVDPIRLAPAFAYLATRPLHLSGQRLSAWDLAQEHTS